MSRSRLRYPSEGRSGKLPDEQRAKFIRHADGADWEGQHVGGLAQGPWALADADGLVFRGDYVDGSGRVGGGRSAAR